jgi:hypothetical protein
MQLSGLREGIADYDDKFINEYLSAKLEQLNRNSARSIML